ncbi:hypothetical protein QBC34DRAFT_388283 [Podospora aff. communis PSN243]|uniref:Uncharacterized protein n=1 Tax=Podospora aff. communis PSN243 TaxID=3040156 RepID=A0AAV9H8T6_9PEZI|nr:hypothetical protein QBC34DRAFT_388283 [Podospora aff. communis PSN243]
MTNTENDGLPGYFSPAAHKKLVSIEHNPKHHIHLLSPSGSKLPNTQLPEIANRRPPQPPKDQPPRRHQNRHRDRPPTLQRTEHSLPQHHNAPVQPRPRPSKPRHSASTSKSQKEGARARQAGRSTSARRRTGAMQPPPQRLQRLGSVGMPWITPGALFARRVTLTIGSGRITRRRPMLGRGAAVRWKAKADQAREAADSCEN